jgi:predicted TIM-barrel fold metal-dependent hydrolase
MLLENFRPRSKMVTKTTLVNRPRYPAIDAHDHLGEPFGGGWGEDILHRHLDCFKAKAPDRFLVFGGVDWSMWETKGDGFADWAADRLKVQKEAGAQGLKIWKPFGLHVRDHKGQLVKVDDRRLSPIWDMAGELNLPVIIHVADPVAFFDPLDETNERWEELKDHPDWVFTSPPFPPFMDILNGLKALVMRHRNTTFIGAHVGCYAENLSWVGRMLDECPNYAVDISARLGELGRQPYSARKFFVQYQDRIVFGSDMSPDLDAYRLYYRFLETDDEYFNYNTGEIPGQGRWFVQGLYLPDEVLKNIYRGNAQRLLGIL